MMRGTLAVTLLLAASVSQAQDDGCTCLWQGSFSEVASESDLLVVGEVTQLKGNAADITLETTLAGESYINPVRVWLNARDYCRPEPDRFPVGSRWVLALHEIESLPEDGFNPSTPNVSFGRVGDYALSACGGYHLAVEGQAVQGNLLPEHPRWEFEPDMTPVLLDLVAGYVNGTVTLEALKQATEENPEVRDLMLDTRSFLRGQDELIED